jgi:hypothetical protein
VQVFNFAALFLYELVLCFQLCFVFKSLLFEKLNAAISFEELLFHGRDFFKELVVVIYGGLLWRILRHTAASAVYRLMIVGTASIQSVLRALLHSEISLGHLNLLELSLERLPDSA